MGSLVATKEFTHILRISNTNVDGRRKIAAAIGSIRGLGRRYAIVCCRKADIDLSKRAGELSTEEIDRIMTVVTHPRQYKIPVWMLNRRKDFTTGKNSHNFSQAVDIVQRDDLERMKKIRLHRGLRHHWGLKVRGQRTKAHGRGKNTK